METNMVDGFKLANRKKFIDVSGLSFLDEIFSLSLPKEIKLCEEDGSCREIYGNPFFDGLMQVIRREVESIVGEELVPTYSFARECYQGSRLTSHRDREGCTYTCSLTLIGSDDVDWPIFCEKGPGFTEVVNQPGDMVVFKGRELAHYRNELKSDFKRSIFMHYVPNQEKYKEYFFDGRESLSVDIEDSSVFNVDVELETFFEGARSALKIMKEHQYGELQ